MKLSDLPKLGAPLENGTFEGVITQSNGTHVAVVLLPDRGSKLTWKKAMNWAEKLGGELPTRPAAAMLFANAKASLPRGWHWTNEARDASYAWSCHFIIGNQSNDHKSYEGSAVAVRLIALEACK